MQPSSDETKRGKDEAGGALRLRRSVSAPEAGGDMRARLILALADTVDADYAERSYPLLEQEKAGRAGSTDSRPPVLRMRSGASVSVQEAVAALVSGTTPAAPVAVAAPVVPGVPPVGRPMMNQKSEAASGQPPAAGGTSSPLPAGAPLAVKRKLEVRSGAAPALSGSAPAFVGSQSVATRAPLLPLPIDAALSGKAPVLMIPGAVVADKKIEAKVVERRKKNSSVGLGAVLVSVFLVLFLGGIFWMQRVDEAADAPGGAGVVGGEKTVIVEAGRAETGALSEAVPMQTPEVKEAPAVAIGQLATVSGTVAWEMADAGWAGANMVADPMPADVVAPGAESRVAGSQTKAPVKAEGTVPVAKAGVAASGESAAARRPAPSPAFQIFVESLKVSGVLQQTPVRAIIDGGTVFAGDVLEPTQGIRLVGADFEQRQLIFEDKTRAQVKVFY